MSEDDIAGLEQARRDALITTDKARLSALVSDDLIWTHANGATDSKTSYLAALGTKSTFLAIDTVQQDIAVYPGAAAIAAELSMTLKPHDGEAFTMRTRASAVWAAEQDGQWRLTRFHSGMVTA